MDIPVLHILIDNEGIPRTTNRRVKVKMIAEKHLIGGDSPAEIAEHYGITPADVYAALAYYEDNREEFERHDRELQPLAEEAQRRSVELKAKILQRMREKSDE